MTANGAPSGSLRLAAPIGVTITGVWVASAAVGLLTGNFTGLEVVSPMMGIFCSYLFGVNIIRTGERTLNVPSRRQRR